MDEITREMGASHAELFRLLDRLPGGATRHIDAGVITLGEGDRRLEIHYSGQGSRRLGALKLPVTQLEFRFHGYTQSERTEFMEAFDHVYQRGGG